MFTEKFKLLVASVLILGGVSLAVITVDVLDKRTATALNLSNEALMQSNEALQRIPTATPTATPTAGLKFTPVSKTAPVTK